MAIKTYPTMRGILSRRARLLKNSLMCGQCHGLGPVLESETPVQCATLYGSYLHAYIPSGGTQTCQQCHMKNGDHYMPPDFNKRDELSARLRESLPLEVQTLAYTYPTRGGEILSHGGGQDEDHKQGRAPHSGWLTVENPGGPGCDRQQSGREEDIPDI